MTPEEKAAKVLTDWHRFASSDEGMLDILIAISIREAIAETEAENQRLKEALGWFLEDERFRVTVGGNPNVVERMLDDARKALKGDQ